MKAVVRVRGHRRKGVWDWTAEVQDKELKELAEKNFINALNQGGNVWDMVMERRPGNIAVRIGKRSKPSMGMVAENYMHHSFMFEMRPINEN